MQRPLLTNQVTPCCGLPFQTMYFIIQNAEFQSPNDKDFVLSRIAQNGTLYLDGWKVLANSVNWEIDSQVDKDLLLEWIEKGRLNCNELKLFIEGVKLVGWFPENTYPYTIKQQAFSQVLKFDKNFTVSSTTQTSDIVITIDNSNQIPMGANYVRILSDGVHIIDLSAFKKQSGSGNFKIENGVLNVLCFWFDGVDYWVNIWQEVAILPPHIFETTNVVFDELTGATYNNGTNVLAGSANQGGYYSNAVNFLDDANIESVDSIDGAVLALSYDKGVGFGWTPNAQNIIAGIYEYSGTTYVATGLGTITNVGSIVGSFSHKRIKRVGNNLVFSVSSDGTTYQDFYTLNAVFNTNDVNVYIKGIFATANGSLKATKTI